MRVLGFLALWAVMMAAMMAPSVYPALRLFAAVRTSRVAVGVRPAPLWAFAAGYLAIWTAVGIPAYGAVSLVPMGMFSRQAQGAALLVAGVYQLTRWKARCLGHCRSPAMFFLHTWRDGRAGAMLMGVHHGAFCVACCWGLMLVLVALGMMNVWWMAAVAAVIFVEKVLPGGPTFGRLVGGAMLATGLALIVAWPAP